MTAGLFACSVWLQPGQHRADQRRVRPLALALQDMLNQASRIMASSRQGSFHSSQQGSSGPYASAPQGLYPQVHPGGSPAAPDAVWRT